MLEIQKNNLENQLKNKVLECDESKNTIKLLEEKLDKAESEFFKQYNKFKEIKEDTAIEIKLLKQSIKNSNEESKNHKKTLSEVNKMIKIKEKTNFNLQRNLENLQEKIKSLSDPFIYNLQ